MRPALHSRSAAACAKALARIAHMQRWTVRRIPRQTAADRSGFSAAVARHSRAPLLRHAYLDDPSWDEGGREERAPREAGREQSWGRMGRIQGSMTPTDQRGGENLKRCNPSSSSLDAPQKATPSPSFPLICPTTPIRPCSCSGSRFIIITNSRTTILSVDQTRRIPPCPGQKRPSPSRSLRRAASATTSIRQAARPR